MGLRAVVVVPAECQGRIALGRRPPGSGPGLDRLAVPLGLAGLLGLGLALRGGDGENG